jgi:type IV secretion system protein VirB10
MQTNDPVQGQSPDVTQAGIVSVNSRGGSGGGVAGKVFFVTGVVGLMLVASFYGYNQYRARQAAADATTHQTGKNESKPAQAGIPRDFDKEQADAAAAAAPPVPGAAPGATATQVCSDGTSGTPALGPDGKALVTGTGAVMRVCSDGHVIVPDINDGSGAKAIGVVSNQASGTPRPSRYGGDVLVSGGGNSSTSSGAVPGMAGYTPSDPAQTAALVQNLVAQSTRSAAGPAGGPPGGMLAGNMPGVPASPPGSVGSELTPSSTPMVTAAMLGDRNMILPKGRSIDCGMSMRLVSDLPGLASCVLSQNVYSDNGKVLLLERGSEAVGEYGAAMAQGQRRIFVLWSRIKTPSGVVINLNSPGADELGTTGLPGIVNNHWWERLGAAFLLSIVEDAIAYETAKTSNSGGAGGVAVYQNTSQTGNNMAEKVLESTINIKPTLYKNQGDRSTIYVARDLDFSSVYALRPR